MITSLHNLLPTRTRTLLRRTYLIRLASVSCSAGVVVVCVGAILLVPSYQMLHTTLTDVEEQVLAQHDVAAQQETLDDELEQLRIRLAQVDQYADPSPVSALLTTILGERPEGVVVRGWSYDRERGVVVLSGTAIERTDLVTYSNTLEQYTLFKSVQLPIGHLAKTSNLSFTITLTIDPDQVHTLYE